MGSETTEPGSVVYAQVLAGVTSVSRDSATVLPEQTQNPELIPPSGSASWWLHEIKGVVAGGFGAIDGGARADVGEINEPVTTPVGEAVKRETPIAI